MKKIRNLITPQIAEWIPRSDEDDVHRKIWMSPNGRVFLTLGGDIYGLHLQVGKLAIITWDKDI